MPGWERTMKHSRCILLNIFRCLLGKPIFHQADSQESTVNKVRLECSDEQRQNQGKHRHSNICCIAKDSFRLSPESPLQFRFLSVSKGNQVHFQLRHWLLLERHLRQWGKTSKIDYYLLGRYSGQVWADWYRQHPIGPKEKELLPHEQRRSWVIYLHEHTYCIWSKIFQNQLQRNIFRWHGEPGSKATRDHDHQHEQRLSRNMLHLSSSHYILQGICRCFP